LFRERDSTSPRKQERMQLNTFRRPTVHIDVGTETLVDQVTNY